jgi:hypothetical protein
MGLRNEYDKVIFVKWKFSLLSDEQSLPYCTQTCSVPGMLPASATASNIQDYASLSSQLRVICAWPPTLGNRHRQSAELRIQTSAGKAEPEMSPQFLRTVLIITLGFASLGRPAKRREDKTKCPHVKAIRNFDLHEVIARSQFSSGVCKASIKKHSHLVWHANFGF